MSDEEEQSGILCLSSPQPRRHFWPWSAAVRSTGPARPFDRLPVNADDDPVTTPTDADATTSASKSTTVDTDQVSYPLDLVPWEGSITPSMRALGLLILVALGFGLGFVSGPAGAAPCPLHAHGAAPASDQDDRAAANADVRIVTAPTMMAAPDPSVASAPHAGPGHAVPEGQSCCHVATADVAAVGPVLDLRLEPDRRTVPSSWLAPRPSPADDIFRPPAFA